MKIICSLFVQCVFYLQSGIIYQINVGAVITVGLPQHLQERRPIFWTHAPQGSLSHWLKQDNNMQSFKFQAIDFFG